MRVIISTVTRPSLRFSHVKSLDYLCFRKAYLEAHRKGADEAILLNHRGELVEGSRTNLFWMKDNVLYTPAIQCGCLNGIGRQLALKNARQKGIPVKFVHAKPQTLFAADKAFLTNSVMGPVPLIC
jgi:branched-subunit amino acid aminotransferase/4-amino-4-deoxychorismate lyase